MQNRKIVYVDLDGVLADFDGAIADIQTLEEKWTRMAEPNFFVDLLPITDAVQSIRWLDKYFDVYILSTAPWEEPEAWMEKRLWVAKHLPEFKKRLILSHHKHLHIGDYLIDDRTANGAGNFRGTLIQFGSEVFSNWTKVIEFFNKVEQINDPTTL